MASFLSIHNHNPFPFFAFLVSLCLLLRFYAFRHTHESPSRLTLSLLRIPVAVWRGLWIALSVCLLLTLWFEYYFVELHCKVADNYYTGNLVMFRRTTRALQEERIPAWIEFATLLNFVRQQYGFNVWEHDSDLSIVKPGSTLSLSSSAVSQLSISSSKPTTSSRSRINRISSSANTQQEQTQTSSSMQLESVEQLQEILGNHGLKSFYLPSRDLLQIYLNDASSGPHIDVWLWTPFEGRDGRVWLSSKEPHLGYNPRLASDLFPLLNATWPGVFDPITDETIAMRGRQELDKAGQLGGSFPNSVLVPKRAKTVSAKEYAQYGTSAFVPTVFKGDCLHNMVQLRFVPFLW